MPWLTYVLVSVDSGGAGETTGDTFTTEGLDATEVEAADDAVVCAAVGAGVVLCERRVSRDLPAGMTRTHACGRSCAEDGRLSECRHECDIGSDRDCFDDVRGDEDDRCCRSIIRCCSEGIPIGVEGGNGFDVFVCRGRRNDRLDGAEGSRHSGSRDGGDNCLCGDWLLRRSTRRGGAEQGATEEQPGREHACSQSKCSSDAHATTGEQMYAMRVHKITACAQVDGRKPRDISNLTSDKGLGEVITHETRLTGAIVALG